MHFFCLWNSITLTAFKPFSDPEKSQAGESHLLLEHKQVVEELNHDLQERDNRIDEVTLEYEAKLKVIHYK